MQWIKVKAHVEGLRTNAEVTNEAADKGSKSAASDIGSPIELGTTTMLAGTAVVAIGGDEEAASPKHLVRALRRDLASNAAGFGNAQRQAMLHMEVSKNSVDEMSISVLIGKRARGRDKEATMRGLLEFAQSNNHGAKENGTHFCPICRALGHSVVGDVQHAMQCMGTTELARALARNLTGIVHRGIQREEQMLEEARAWRERTSAGKCDVVTEEGEDEWCRICNCEEAPPQHDCSCEPKVFVSKRTMSTVKANCTQRGATRSADHADYVCRLARGECTRGKSAKWGSTSTRSRKMSTAAMKYVVPELWGPLCKALSCQVEVNTTAATRGTAYDATMEWTSELDAEDSRDTTSDWTNVICVTRPADEEIAATLDHYRRWVDAAPKSASRRAAVVLLRGSRKTDARVHCDANEAWKEFLRIDDGHRLTRPVGIHTSTQRAPALEDVGLIVLVCENSSAAAKWPLDRAGIELLIAALDEAGIERDEFKLKLPVNQVWTEWWKKKKVTAGKPPLAYRDINPCFDERQMDHIYSVAPPTEPPVRPNAPSERFAAKLTKRLEARWQRQQAQPQYRNAAGEAMWEWQEQNKHHFLPSASNEALPRRFSSLGFLCKGYFGTTNEGYPITGVNNRRTISAVSRAVIATVKAARRARSKLLHQLKAKVAEQSAACTTCHRNHHGNGGLCTQCKSRDRVMLRRTTARRCLMTPGTSIRAELLAGRPIDAKRMAIDVVGDATAPPYEIRPIRAVCSKLKVATVISGAIHCEDQMLIRPRPGGPADHRLTPYDPITWRVVGRSRTTKSSAEACNMVDRFRRRNNAGEERGRIRLGIYGEGKEVALAQETSFRSITTRNASPGVHSRLIDIRQKQRVTVRKLAIAHRGVEGAAKTARLRGLSRNVRQELSASRAHWLLFSHEELRRACAMLKLKSTGKRETLAQRLSDSATYGAYARYLDHCTDVAAIHGRCEVHFPPLETVQLLRTWTGRDVQLEPKCEAQMGRGQRRKQKTPRRLSQHGTVRPETWRITPGLLDAEQEKTSDERECAKRKATRDDEKSGKVARAEKRGPRLRELDCKCITGHNIKRKGIQMKLMASADGNEIIIVDEVEGLVATTLEQTVDHLASTLPVWKTVQQMLRLDGFTEGAATPVVAEEVARTARRIANTLITREDVTTYDDGPEARRGDVCIFPVGYFKGMNEEQYGVILTSRGVGTREQNETKREFVDVALPDELVPWELNITDPEWKSVIRMGNLRNKT
jgi:hypothetical protein